MLAQLISKGGGPNIVLDKPIILIGRHPECDVQIHSRKISRRHCCVAQVGDSLVVRDLGSTNGVRINGARVVEGTLQVTDELTIGNQPYRLTWEESEVPQPPPEKAPRPKERVKKPESVMDAIILQSNMAMPTAKSKSKSRRRSRSSSRKPSNSSVRE
jgi:pSer/pThr/pTyr-binding forkhead associated (FHA) protein